MKKKERSGLRTILAANLAFIRKGAGLSQSELAKKAGFTHNFINDVENSKKGVSLETLDKLARTLNVEPFQFFLTPEQRSAPIKREMTGIINMLNKKVNLMFDDTVKKILKEND